MTQFHETRMGHTFFEGTVPKMVRALERIGDALEERNTDESIAELSAYLAVFRTLRDTIHEKELAGHFPHETLVLLEKFLEKS